MQMIPMASSVVHISSSSSALPLAMAGWGSLQKQKPQFLIPVSENRTADFHLPSLSSIHPSSSLKSAAVASETTAVSSSDQNQTKNKYYFVIANAKFMLDEEEHFKELMFERLRLFSERNQEQDFWLVIEPKFLDKFPSISNRLNRPAVALVSTNGPWITYMKLRLDRVLSESYEAESLEEALGSNPTRIEFEKPENWVAPYPKYEYGWWEAFLPPGSQ